MRDARRSLVIGAGAGGKYILDTISRNPRLGICPIGFLDDNPSKQGEEIDGITVLGPTTILQKVVMEKKISLVIIAIPSISGSVIQSLIQTCEEANVEYRIVAGIFDMLAGRADVSPLRKVSAEDLIRRKPNIVLREQMINWFKERVVLVTGASGSIGSEICRQISNVGVEKLVLFDVDESGIFQLDLDIQEKGTKTKVVPVVGDIRNPEKLRRVFKGEKPNVVFHAAAYKHVPLMEENPEETVFTNIFGTKNVAEACLDFGVETFVNISTDKAVNPTSIMGVSKRTAEMVCRMVLYDSQVKFGIVRFGNVLESRGSAIPLFKAQIAKGGPVTVTHPEMTRYFMSLPEAAQLVMQAGYFAKDGEVFVLDMGSPVKILDLVETLIRESGFVPHEEIPIEFIGIRPGEKLYEEPLTQLENAKATKNDQIFTVPPDDFKTGELAKMLNHLKDAAERCDPAEIRHIYKTIVPTYNREVS